MSNSKISLPSYSFYKQQLNTLNILIYKHKNAHKHTKYFSLLQKLSKKLSTFHPLTTSDLYTLYTSIPNIIMMIKNTWRQFILLGSTNTFIPFVSVSLASLARLHYIIGNWLEYIRLYCIQNNVHWDEFEDEKIEKIVKDEELDKQVEKVEKIESKVIQNSLSDSFFLKDILDDTLKEKKKSKQSTPSTSSTSQKQSKASSSHKSKWKITKSCSFTKKKL